MTPPLNVCDFDPARWEGLLEEASRRHRVPGIVAGVFSLNPENGTQRRFVASTGVTNRRTGVVTDRDTVCQVGSITKIATAAMIMQLQEEGKLTLETRVVDILPDFTLNSPHAAEITVGNLLTHTSGIDGDLFTDTGRGEQAVADYVSMLSEVESLFPPSAGWSYCNSGYVVAGRIIEVLDGRSWDDSLSERISKPLDLERFFTLPEEILAHRHQYGHTRQPGQMDWEPAPVSGLARSMGAAGGITSSVDDLLTFASMFLAGGSAPSGRRLLTEKSVAAMATPRWTLNPTVGNAITPQWGVGWMLNEWDGHKVYFHPGTTIGNRAWLHVLPDDGLAFVVFVNGGAGGHAAYDIYSAFAEHFAGLRPPAGPKPTGSQDQAALTVEERWLGTYSDHSTSLEVLRTEDGTYAVRVTDRIFEDELGDATAGPTVMELLPTDAENRFVVRADAYEAWSPIGFTEVDGQPAAYYGLRCLPRRD